MLTALFTKPECLPPARTVFTDRSPIHSFRDFFHSSEIVPDKAGDGSAGGLLNSAVTVLNEQTLTALFTKLLYSLPPYRMGSGGPFCMVTSFDILRNMPGKPVEWL